MVVFTLCFFLIILIYATMIVLFTEGITKLKKNSSSADKQDLFFSIIVPFRNEENNVLSIISSLKKLDYLFEKHEILLVDDHSTDKSVQKIREQEDLPENFRLIHLTQDKYGKKEAIAFGVLHALGDYIVTTDCDSMVPETWLQAVSKTIHEKKSKLLIGPVKMTYSDPWESLQALEFLSLIGSGMGTAGYHWPILANGANLIFEKNIFEKNDLKTKFASGDDMFLLEAVKKKYGRKAIAFVFDDQAIVSTRPQTSIKAFFQQRVRWLRKSSGYEDKLTIWVGIVVFVTNLMILAGGFILCWIPSFWNVFLIGFGFKFFVDFMLLHETTSFLKQKELRSYAFLLAIIYPFYTFFVTLLSLFTKPEWKDRIIT